MAKDNSNTGSNDNTKQASGSAPADTGAKKESKVKESRTVLMRAITQIDQVDDFGDRVSTAPGKTFKAEKEEAKRLRDAGVAQFASDSGDGSEEA